MTTHLNLENFSLAGRPANRVYQERMDAFLFRPLDVLAREKPYLFENGFALLALELQFFEPHGRLLASEQKFQMTSRQYFDLAFLDFLNYIEREGLLKPEVKSLVLSLKLFRITRGRIFGDMGNLINLSIDSGKLDSHQPFYLSTEKDFVLVNPWNFVEALKMYFNHYVETAKFPFVPVS